MDAHKRSEEVINHCLFAIRVVFHDIDTKELQLSEKAIIGIARAIEISLLISRCSMENNSVVEDGRTMLRWRKRNVAKVRRSSLLYI